MKNLTMKRVLAGVLGAATMIASSLTMASACTTIYAGANRTQEGTKFIARSEDYGSDMNKLWFVSEAGAYSGTFRGCPEYGPFTYELSHPSYRFTYFKNDNVYDGVCPECGEENAQHASYTEFGTNEKGVSVSATETISGTDAVLAVDPYRDAGWAQENGKPAGIEEGDIPTVLLSEAASAREALDLLLSIYATYGCADGAGLFITDQQESWYIENCSGTQYVAIKLNDDLLFLEPNMAIIGSVDLDDTENVVASPKLIETAKAAGTFTGDEAENIINFRASYAGRLDSADKRLVEGLNYLNSAYSYDADQLVADNSRFTISNLDASGAIVPLYTNISADRTLTVDDILNYYKLSTIAKSGNQEIEIFQIFKDRPMQYATVGWVAVGDLACNVFVPYYPMLIDAMYEGYQAGTPEVQFTTEKPTEGLFYPYAKRSYNRETGEVTTTNGYRILPEGWEKSYYWSFEILNDYVRYFVKEDGSPVVSDADKTYIKAKLNALQQEFYQDFVSMNTLQASKNARALATENGASMAKAAQRTAQELISYVQGSGTLTRADAIYTLWLQEGSPKAKSAAMPFADVASGDYFYEAVVWAAENGIVSGVDAKTFSPDAPCTRAQAAVIAYRTAKSPAADAEGYLDVANTSYYAQAASWAKTAGAVSGEAFNPNAACTKTQLDAFVTAAA